MYFLYVDESGDPGYESSCKHFVMLGTILHESKWKDLTAQIRVIKKKYFSGNVDLIEMHYYNLRRAKPPFNKLTHGQRFKLAEEIFALIGSVELTLLAAVIHKEKHRLKYRFPGAPDLLAFELLAERFDMFLDRQQGKDKSEKGIVVFDTKTRWQDKKLRDLQDRFYRKGTSARQINNIIETIFFVPSESSVIVQISDFCAYATFSKYEHKNEELFKKIKDRFDTFKGKLVGIKAWP